MGVRESGVKHGVFRSWGNSPKKIAWRKKCTSNSRIKKFPKRRPGGWLRQESSMASPSRCWQFLGSLSSLADEQQRQVCRPRGLHLGRGQKTADSQDPMLPPKGRWVPHSWSSWEIVSGGRWRWERNPNGIKCDVEAPPPWQVKNEVRERHALWWIGAPEVCWNSVERGEERFLSGKSGEREAGVWRGILGASTVYGL